MNIIDTQIADLEPEERARYWEALSCGIDHEEALETARGYVEGPNEPEQYDYDLEDALFGSD